jgi:hypothetical protein
LSTNLDHRKEEHRLSIKHRRTKTVYAVIQELTAQGHGTLLPGDVTSALRERGQPLAAWEVRREFSVLEAQGLVVLDEATGSWVLGQGDANEATG